VKGYIGIPYVDLGRDETGCDCYGLVRLVLKENTNIDLPERQSADPNNFRLSSQTIISVSRTLEEVDLQDRKKYDIVIMSHGYRPTLPCHVGIVFDDLKILHTEKGPDSHLVHPGSPSIANRIIRLVRFPNLMEKING
jgi:cell wall-associated NlpC family hydrolase